MNIKKELKIAELKANLEKVASGSLLGILKSLFKPSTGKVGVTIDNNVLGHINLDGGFGVGKIPKDYIEGTPDVPDTIPEVTPSEKWVDKNKSWLYPAAGVATAGLMAAGAYALYNKYQADKKKREKEEMKGLV